MFKRRIYGSLCAIISCIAAVMCTVSCSPSPEILEVGFKDINVVSVAHLKALYKGYPVVINENMAIRGVVISSDRSLNFYNTIVVEDASGGIEVRLRAEELYTMFARGSTVTVHCNTLVLGTYGRLLQLGSVSLDPRYEVEPIPAANISRHIVLDTTIPESEIKINELRITDLAPKYLGCTVMIQGVEFIDAEMGLSWSEAGSDTDRHLTDRNGNIVIVRTNRHAAFADKILPSGSGDITGVLSYFNNSYQIVIINLYGAVMTGKRF